MEERLFVYGTLRRGSPNEFADLLAANSRFLGNARMRGRLHQLSGYSGAIPSDQPDEWVRGELFHLEDPCILRTLDEYEGSEFQRVQVTISLDSGRDLDCWVYIFLGKK